MGEKFSQSPEEKREARREADFNKIERLKENLMKLEKSVIDEVDEATQSARGAIQAMGYGINPVTVSDDDSDDYNDDEEEMDAKNDADKYN